MRVQPLTIKNARVRDGQGAVERDLYTSDVVLGKPHPKAINVDLSGYTIFPGLINAHDHLELNHFPRTKFRERYDDAHQWGEDINARLNESPFKELRAYPLEDRLLIGGLKNLLCGATTVAHHNPPHKPLFRKDFPVRVLRKYGWAHSLHFSTDEEIVRSYRSTPPDVPWFIHLAEGTDDVAAREYQRLKTLGCVGKNTILIHAVGLTDIDSEDAGRIFPGVIWCPTTNMYLLAETAKSDYWWSMKLVSLIVLGNDSRLSADGDLLDEMRAVIAMNYAKADDLLEMVLTHPARLLRFRQVGDLQPAMYSDFIAIPSNNDDAKALCTSHRADLALVVRGGIPQIGDPDVMAKFPHIETVEATLDGVPKLINTQLTRQIAKSSLKEPGLELLGKPKPRMFTFK